VKLSSSNHRQYSIGVDYGTNSVRALIIDVADGQEVAAGLYDYPSGDAGILLDPKDPNLARQNPSDYVKGFSASIRAALKAARRDRAFRADRVVGIGIDATGSTPIPVDREGMPLAFHKSFAAIWRFALGFERITPALLKRPRSLKKPVVVATAI
jgi:L-ribulokinase